MEKIIKQLSKSIVYEAHSLQEEVYEILTEKKRFIVKKDGSKWSCGC
jgi:hypothetical protein